MVKYIFERVFKKELEGITNTMLTNTLRELIKDRLVQRIQYNEIPLRVEYSFIIKVLILTM